MASFAELVWLVPVVPLILSPFPIFAGDKLPRKGSFVAIFACAVSTVISAGALLTLPSIPYNVSVQWLLPGTATSIDVGFYLDGLSALMITITSGIATLILVYSLEYMSHEEGLPRYWTEMMIFTGSMLGFALADSVILMYVFWELIGACSYLLIGFWYTKPEAASAAKKAFVLVRVGDVGFLIGMILLYTNGHTLNLPAILSSPATLISSPQMRTIIALLVFAGAIGKSAQLPLFPWLPDAMEGPTTVSALIHSATMVAAGVYLVARLYPFFQVAPYALLVVGAIGALSAFVAATMGLVSFDIKRVLAYSTMSQLGYMMVALGVGAYGAAMFHLMNHAVFKAMLFLSAGAILHATGARDLREMGGLLKKMKVTGLAFLIGGLALSGIPPFNGYFSKDLIIGAAYQYGLVTGDFWIYLLVLISALLTAAYIFRAFFVAFILPPKSGATKEVHEVSLTMTIPMVILIGFTLVTGWLWSPLMDVFQPFVTYAASLGATPQAPSYVGLLTLAFALTGIGLAYLVYIRATVPPERFSSGRVLSKLRNLIMRSYYFDAAYDRVAAGVENGIALALDYFDRFALDGLVNGIGRSLVKLGRDFRSMETGEIRNYVAVMVIGAVLLILLFEVL